MEKTNEKPETWECVMTIAMGFLIGITLMVGFNDMLPRTYIFEKTTKIIALKDVNEVEDSFFLIKMNSSKTNYYCYLSLTETNVIKPNLVPADDGKIIFVKNEGKGLVKEYREQFKKWWYKLFDISKSKIKYEIFIPRGSILE